MFDDFMSLRVMFMFDDVRSSRVVFVRWGHVILVSRIMKIAFATYKIEPKEAGNPPQKKHMPQKQFYKFTSTTS